MSQKKRATVEKVTKKRRGASGRLFSCKKLTDHNPYCPSIVKSIGGNLI
jgi:hypothetical protein